MNRITTIPAIAAVAALSLMQSPAHSHGSRAWLGAQSVQTQREKTYCEHDDAESDEKSASFELPLAPQALSTSLALLQASVTRSAPPARLETYQDHATPSALDAVLMRGNLLDIHA